MSEDISCCSDLSDCYCNNSFDCSRSVFFLVQDAYCNIFTFSYLFRSALKAILRVNSGDASPTVAMQISNWPLDAQKGLTLPQQIIIPPSHGNIGPDGRPQPQTYQISSEIRISYDQKDRPVSHEVSALSKAAENKEQSPPTYLQPRVRFS